MWIYNITKFISNTAPYGLLNFGGTFYDIHMYSVLAHPGTALINRGS